MVKADNARKETKGQSTDLKRSLRSEKFFFSFNDSGIAESLNLSEAIL